MIGFFRSMVKFISFEIRKVRKQVSTLKRFHYIILIFNVEKCEKNIKAIRILIQSFIYLH